ncbi:MAG: DUF1810 domain-containing protein [Flavobacterium sp.]|nr:DUF1810 domain-containing protein [Flavobacterium sp.]
MEKTYDLNRFLEAQKTTYNEAFSEIKKGKKQSHWMWYIFPQIAGLGFSEYNVFYALKNIEEATQYLQHPVLGKRLIEISKAVLEINGKIANEIFGKPDDRKLKSCMTLFAQIKNTEPIFQKVLDKYYQAIKDEKTLQLLNN